jgi:hypothetical protein
LKRPSSFFVKELQTYDADAFIHYVKRNVDNNYFIQVGFNGIEVYDDDGTNRVVNYSSPSAETLITDYLSTAASFLDDIRILTIADTSIVLNRKTKVLKDFSLVTGGNTQNALIYVKEGQFGKTYKVVLTNDDDFIVGRYTTPDGSSSLDTYDVDTANIAAELQADLVADAIGSVGTWVFEVRDNILAIENLSKDFSITSADGFGDTAMYPIKEDLQLFSDLPRKAPLGFKVRITGNADDVSADAYWVEAFNDDEYQPNATGFPRVVWRETIAPGVFFKYFDSTMPFKITEETNGEFTVGLINYEEREIGDDDTAPFPSFVDNYIEGLFFFRNRLGFFTGSTVSMSESGNFFNYFPNSVAALLDADPVEVTVNTADASDIKHAVPWREELLLTSDKHQHVIRSQGVLSNSTIEASKVTEFDVSPSVSPVLSGSSLFFTAESTNSSEVKEYYFAETIKGNDASTVTSHVPNLIPRNTKWLRASPDAKLVAVGAKGKIFIYQYIWSGEQKVQSAWHTFTFEDKLEVVTPGVIDNSERLEVNNGFFKNDELFLFVSYVNSPRSPALLKVDLSSDLVTSDEDFLIYLDNRIDTNNVDVSSVEASGNTVYTLPMQPSSDTVAVSLSEDSYGQSVEVLDISGSDITVKGTSLGTLALGVTYKSKYTLGTTYMRSGNSQGSRAITAGRTNLLKMDINYFNSTNFKVEVAINNRTARTKEFSGRSKGVSTNTFGKMPVDTGIFSVPINAINTSVEVSFINDTYLPSNFQFADVTLRYWTTRGRNAN